MSSARYILTAVWFGTDKASVRCVLPADESAGRKYEASEELPVTPEHARALSQYIGEEVEFYVVPTSTTFDNVVTFRPKVSP